MVCIHRGILALAMTLIVQDAQVTQKHKDWLFHILNFIIIQNIPMSSIIFTTSFLTDIPDLSPILSTFINGDKLYDRFRFLDKLTRICFLTALFPTIVQAEQFLCFLLQMKLKLYLRVGEHTTPNPSQHQNLI